MAQIEKLENLIKRILKEELEELTVPSKDGTLQGVTDPEAKAQAKNALLRKKAVDFVDPTKMKEEEMQDTQLESMPTGTEIAGQVAEIVDKLKTMSEGSDDPKKQKLAAKAMKQMESAKAALEALTSHETMLQEKQQQEEEKEAEKHVGKFKKALTKLVKEPAAVEKISSKMDAKKMAELKKKMKSGELDEEKLARVMLQHSLKEGWIK